MSFYHILREGSSCANWLNWMHHVDDSFSIIQDFSAVFSTHISGRYVMMYLRV